MLNAARQALSQTAAAAAAAAGSTASNAVGAGDASARGPGSGRSGLARLVFPSPLPGGGAGGELGGQVAWPPLPDFYPLAGSLDSAQLTAIRNILCSPYREHATLLTGPAGAGKSMVLCEAASQLVAGARKGKVRHRVLLVAASSSHADALAKNLWYTKEHLRDKGVLRRLSVAPPGGGDPGIVTGALADWETVSPDLKKCHRSLPATSAVPTAGGAAGSSQALQDIANASVVVCTLAGCHALRFAGFGEGYFTHLFLDDAAAINEAEAAIALALADSSSSSSGGGGGGGGGMSKVVLAGDPIPASSGGSLLARLCGHPAYTDLSPGTTSQRRRINLVHSYTMPPSLLRLVSSLWYGDRLSVGAANLEQGLGAGDMGSASGMFPGAEPLQLPQGKGGLAKGGAAALPCPKGKDAAAKGGGSAVPWMPPPGHPGLIWAQSPAARIAFVGIQGQTAQGGGSRTARGGCPGIRHRSHACNPMEVHEACAQVVSLCGQGLPAREICLAAPTASQVGLCQSRLEALLGPGEGRQVTCCTMEELASIGSGRSSISSSSSFHGGGCSARDSSHLSSYFYAMVVSCVATTDEFADEVGLGTTAGGRSLCGALCRVRGMACLIGHPATIAEVPWLRYWLHAASQEGGLTPPDLLHKLQSSKRGSGTEGGAVGGGLLGGSLGGGSAPGMGGERMDPGLELPSLAPPLPLGPAGESTEDDGTTWNGLQGEPKEESGPGLQWLVEGDTPASYVPEFPARGDEARGNPRASTGPAAVAGEPGLSRSPSIITIYGHITLDSTPY